MVHPIAHALESKNYGETQEKKADNLVPQGSSGLDDSGKNMFRQKATLFEGLAFHSSMVTKTSLDTGIGCSKAAKLPIESL